MVLRRGVEKIEIIDLENLTFFAYKIAHRKNLLVCKKIILL